MLYKNAYLFCLFVQLNFSRKDGQQETGDAIAVVSKVQPQEHSMPLQNSLHLKLNDFLNFKTPLVG